MNNKEIKPSINWEIEISILNNMGVMGEVFKVLGIASAIPALLVFILWAADGFPKISDLGDFKYFLALILILIIVTALIILAVGNKYPTRYELTPQGVTFITLEKRRKKNNFIALLLILLGGAKGNISAMGTGVLAASRQNMNTNWKKVRKIVFHKKRRSISLISTDMTKNILFCKEDNISEVFNAVKLYCPKAKVIER